MKRPNWSSVPCSNRLSDFSINIPRCYKDAYINGLLP